MRTYSLLLKSLNQTIDRDVLEEASMAAPSVARADCPRMVRELSGIFVSQLEHDEALSFQSALAGRGFPTDVVADDELPVLHESSQIQRVETRGEMLVLTDSLGRERIRSLSDLVFIAGGFINRIEFKTEWHQHLDFQYDGNRGGMPKLVTEREFKEERELSFRLDFFFWSGPHRLNLSLGRETVIFHQGQPIRLKNTAALQSLAAAMAKLLPPERLGLALREPELSRIYQNPQCYEKEIRWHFHRLEPSGSEKSR